MKLQLPPEYGPFCNKILDDFIKHHNINPLILRPEPGLFIEEALSRIFDAMLHSMGEGKREEVLNEIAEYKAHSAYAKSMVKPKSLGQRMLEQNI